MPFMTTVKSSSDDSKPSEYKSVASLSVSLDALLRFLDDEVRRDGCTPGTFSARESLQYIITMVFAFICGLIVILLMILCLASSNWLIAHKFRQGLWEQCVEEDAPLPLPFGLNVKPGCYVARTVAYIQAAAALCVITLLCDIAATVMTGCGLCSKNPVRKYLMYRLAFYVMVCALLCILIALVIYPACFAAEIEESNRQLWEFGWAYGVGWGAAIFLFGAILLLLCDKETEEIYYRERALPHDGAADSKA
ncbi:hypothetical protein HPB51_011243 [Rhipicephalus microplus]|uniref:Uncharacterized protein n=1 Tax=Rhipicephalus microplus TaxID=6941 RepID=A0A9J6F1M8_RHIMP|nr:hypothetical protein HPB51_011243 [Rhipicephalus microplus]